MFVLIGDEGGEGDWLYTFPTAGVGYLCVGVRHQGEEIVPCCVGVRHL